MLYGFPTQTFRLHTLFAELLFHGLDLSAILVLTGIALSLWRRFRENTVARTLAKGYPGRFTSFRWQVS
jgi:MFS transporter, NNP family, nitrate/nitrite transporter